MRIIRSERIIVVGEVGESNEIHLSEGIIFVSESNKIIVSEGIML